MFKRNGKAYRRQRGFTLMEVLVTMVILSIGLLGVAGLQFRSLQGNVGGMEGTLATLMALDAADRLRANPAGVSAGSYDLAVADGSDPNCITSTCTAAQVAQYDIWQWRTERLSQLPQGQGVICLDSTPDDGASAAEHACDGLNPNGVYAIKLWWDHDKDASLANDATPLRRYVLSLIP
ncbi:type IV pilus modification protein PilV [Candidatus Endoriftia persephone]|jgi:type IV pilus assembly protein PilV|nr:type IV pilus modification protein PilV [Candidatus Endoriftia persephone]EGV52093.1 type IV pilus modification protein PilV [endosymbiont of Riftia pachyptila (vent Ph05)]USF87220.1 type IV pilus modification protein PilV [Candidatus Endoriftia persephone]